MDTERKVELMRMGDRGVMDDLVAEVKRGNLAEGIEEIHQVLYDGLKRLEEEYEGKKREYKERLRVEHERILKILTAVYKDVKLPISYVRGKNKFFITTIHYIWSMATEGYLYNEEREINPAKTHIKAYVTCVEYDVQREKYFIGIGIKKTKDGEMEEITRISKAHYLGYINDTYGTKLSEDQ